MISRAIHMFVNGMTNSYDFSNRNLNPTKFYGKAINQGYIERRTWSDGTPMTNPTLYRLTEMGKQYAYEMYGDDASPGGRISRMIEFGW